MKKGILCILIMGAFALQAQKPNIVLIISDDQSFNSIGYTSINKVYTPTIDMLAKEGMIFTNAHHPVTVCSPSRYSMLTGKFSGRCAGEEYLAKFPPGILTRTENNCELFPGEAHLGNILQANGYRTGFVGKSHVMEHDILRKDNWPAYGLQTYGQTDDPYDPAVSAKMKHNHDVYQEIVRSYGFDYADGIYMANVKELNNDALNVHNLEWTVDKARKFIEKEKENPFFLFFSTTLHHGPVPWGKRDGAFWSSFDADPKLTGEGYIDTTWDFMPGRQEIQDKYVAAGYPESDAYALLLDEGVKAIYDKIAELNLDENTLIIYMPDHGMWRHGKATLHDFGLKVPMFMYWKGTIIKGSVYKGLVQTVDFLPTILDLADIALPDGYVTDGISLKTIIESGSGEGHASLFGELGYARAVKTKDWKYIAVRYPEDIQDKIDNGETFDGWEGRVLEYPYLTNNKHLGYHASRQNPNYFDLDQLYDLAADSAETVNVADQHPEVLKQMRELLSEYLVSFENRPFREFTLTAADPPARATAPSPRNGSAAVPFNQTISWTSAYQVTSHDIYFGKTNPPPFVASSTSVAFDPGDLEGSTTYYWRIDAKNQIGTTTGDTWSFSTGTAQASVPANPFPAASATGVRKNTVLRWSQAENASSYRLYLGAGTAEFVAEVAEEHYDPGYLKSNTLYNWRVDAVNPFGMVTEGTSWSFRTGFGNIAPEAVVTASSVADAINYSGQKTTDGIYLIANRGEWRSDGEEEPWLELNWSQRAVVDHVQLYDRVGVFTQIVDGKIFFSDGSSIQTGSLPWDGSAKLLAFSPREIKSLRLTVTEGIGQIGLAEIEVFDTVMYVSSPESISAPSCFQMHPNPATGKFISLQGLYEGIRNRIFIYAPDGQLLAVYNTSKREMQLDLSPLPPGVYFIRIQNDRYDHTDKLII